MPRVRVLRPFRQGAAGKVCRRGTEIDVPAGTAKILVSYGYALEIEGAATGEEPKKDGGAAETSDKSKKKAKK